MPVSHDPETKAVTGNSAIIKVIINTCAFQTVKHSISSFQNKILYKIFVFSYSGGLDLCFDQVEDGCSYDGNYMRSPVSMF